MSSFYTFKGPCLKRKKKKKKPSGLCVEITGSVGKSQVDNTVQRPIDGKDQRKAGSKGGP